MQNLQINTKKETLIKKEVGDELLKIEIIYPMFDINGEKNAKVEHIALFYKEIVNNCKRYAEGTLFERIKGEYYDEREKRGRHRYRKYIYRLECRAGENEGERPFVSIHIDISLLRAGKVLEAKSLLHTWDIALGVLVPAKKQKKREKKERQTT